MDEAVKYGWYGYRLLTFLGKIICEGDATNISEMWDGPDPDSKYLIEEEISNPNGFKHLMIAVPKPLWKQHGKIWKDITDNNVKKTLEQRTLKKLGYSISYK